MNIAQQIFFKQAALQAARFWANVEKKAEQYSAKPFNPAIGYPPKSGMTPMQHYKNQRYRSGLEVDQKAKNPNYKFTNDYTTAMAHYGNLSPKPPVAPVAPASPGQTAYANPAAQQEIFNKYQGQINAIE